jgi:hypothetical protein
MPIVTLATILDAIIIILLAVLAVLVFRRLVQKPYVRNMYKQAVAENPWPHAKRLGPTRLQEISFEDYVVNLIEERHAIKDAQVELRRRVVEGSLDSKPADKQIRQLEARLKQIDSELTRAGVL